MTRTGYILETFFNGTHQNIYELKTPDFNEPNFYRQSMAKNAFFWSMRNPIAHSTEVRQFTYHQRKDEIFLHQLLTPILKTFHGIKEFFEYIGYDPKTRKYSSGEKMRVWDKKLSRYR